MTPKRSSTVQWIPINPRRVVPLWVILLFVGMTGGMLAVLLINM